MSVGSLSAQDILGRRKGWTPIAVLLGDSGGVAPHLLELARERRWQLQNLNITEGQAWSGTPPVGALIGYLPDNLVVRRLLAEGVPTVRIGRWPNPEDDKVPAVISSGPGAGELAADHFAEREFKHVACVAHDPRGSFEAVYRAFAARAAEHSMSCHVHRQRSRRALLGRASPSSFASKQAVWEARQTEFTDWLGELSRPVGLLAPGDVAGSRFCDWAIAGGFRVPEDVAVLGIGNEAFTCESAPVPLSSVFHDPKRISARAVEVLAGLMQGARPDRNTIQVPPSGVVTRQSTDVLAASDPYVVEALRYMAGHIEANPSVGEIAERIGVSRRTLEIAFKRELGRGVNAELRRRRMDKARQFILVTDWPISRVAQELAFSSTSSLCRDFRAAYGISPAEFRRTRRERREGTDSPR